MTIPVSSVGEKTSPCLLDQVGAIFMPDIS
jgi:hypothetical protein